MQSALLTDAGLRSLAADLPEWNVREGRLVREWTFPDFAAAMLFVNGVAQVAEHAHHHPDIDIRYNRVLISLMSHDAGGLTLRDTALARKLDHLVL